jgi:hypothetical protein
MYKIDLIPIIELVSILPMTEVEPTWYSVSCGEKPGLYTKPSVNILHSSSVKLEKKSR